MQQEWSLTDVSPSTFFYGQLMETRRHTLRYKDICKSLMGYFSVRHKIQQELNHLVRNSDSRSDLQFICRYHTPLTTLSVDVILHLQLYLYISYSLQFYVKTNTPLTVLCQDTYSTYSFISRHVLHLQISPCQNQLGFSATTFVLKQQRPATLSQPPSHFPKFVLPSDSQSLLSMITSKFHKRSHLEGLVTRQKLCLDDIKNK